MARLCEYCKNFNIQIFKDGLSQQYLGSTVQNTVDPHNAAQRLKQTHLLTIPLARIEEHGVHCMFCRLLQQALPEALLAISRTKSTSGQRKTRERDRLFVHLRAKRLEGHMELETLRITHFEILVATRRTNILGYHGKIHVYALPGTSSSRIRQTDNLQRVQIYATC